MRIPRINPETLKALIERILGKLPKRARDKVEAAMEKSAGVPRTQNALVVYGSDSPVKTAAVIATTAWAGYDFYNFIHDTFFSDDSTHRKVNGREDVDTFLDIVKEAISRVKSSSTADDPPQLDVLDVEYAESEETERKAKKTVHDIVDQSFDVDFSELHTAARVMKAVRTVSRAFGVIEGRGYSTRDIQNLLQYKEDLTIFLKLNDADMVTLLEANRDRGLF